MSETCCDRNIYTYTASLQNADVSTRQTIASQTEKNRYMRGQMCADVVENERHQSLRGVWRLFLNGSGRFDLRCNCSGQTDTGSLMDISRRQRGQVWRNVLIDRPALWSFHRTAMIYRLMEVQSCCETNSMLDASGASKLNCSGVNQQHLHWKRPCVVPSVVNRRHISIVTFWSGFYLPVLINCCSFFFLLDILHFINTFIYFIFNLLYNFILFIL